MCALHEGRVSGKGQVVDAAMVDGVTSLLTVFHGFRQAGKLTPERVTNVLDGGAPYYTTYETRDGKYVAVAAIEPRFYAILIEHLGLDVAALPPQDDCSRWPELRAAMPSASDSGRAKNGSSSSMAATPVFRRLSRSRRLGTTGTMHRAVFVNFEDLEYPAPAPRPRTPGRLRRAPAFAGRDTVEALQDWG